MCRGPVGAEAGEGEEPNQTGALAVPASLSQVSVHVSPVDGLCLAGGGGLAQQVLVPARSARPVGFSVVPTAAAAVSLKVVARGSSEFPVGDAVSKVLQIEVNGVPWKPDPQAPRFTPWPLAPSPLARPEAQSPNPTLWSVYRVYSSDPALSRNPHSKPWGACTGGAAAGLGDQQSLRACFPRDRRKEPPTQKRWSMNSIPWVSGPGPLPSEF